jgi:hypothetical protein
LKISECASWVGLDLAKSDRTGGARAEAQRVGGHEIYEELHLTTRYILNGVHLTPEEGGMLIPADGRRLAGAPARVPEKEFVLPTAAVHVLAHPDFTTRDAALMQPGKEDATHIQFRSGPHTLIAKTIEGRHPGYQHVIPSYLPQSVTIPETHKAALITWLRTLKGKSSSVRLRVPTLGRGIVRGRFRLGRRGVVFSGGCWGACVCCGRGLV